MEKAGKAVALWIIVMGGLVLVMNPQPFANGSRLLDAKPTTNSSSSSSYEEGDRMKDEHENRTWIWPLPAEWSKGTTTLVVNAQLELVLEGNGGVTSGSSIVADAFERYCKHMYAHQSEKDVLRKTRRRKARNGPALQRLVVNISSADETLNLGTEESYTLSVPAPGKRTEALLEAATVYGALRGLEWFDIRLSVSSFDLTSQKDKLR